MNTSEMNARLDESSLDETLGMNTPLNNSPWDESSENASRMYHTSTNSTFDESTWDISPGLKPFETNTLWYELLMG